MVHVDTKRKSLELANTQLYYLREGWILPDRETTRRISPAVSCVRQQICIDVVRTWKMACSRRDVPVQSHGVTSRANWSSERNLVAYNSPPGPDRTAWWGCRFEPEWHLSEGSIWRTEVLKRLPWLPEHWYGLKVVKIRPGSTSPSTSVWGWRAVLEDLRPRLRLRPSSLRSSRTTLEPVLEASIVSTCPWVI